MNCTRRSRVSVRSACWTTPSQTDEGVQLLEHLEHDLLGKPTGELRLTDAPVKALDLIGEHDSVHGQIGGERDLEGIALQGAGAGTQDRQTDLVVLALQRENGCRSAPGLLVACLRAEGDPDDITALRGPGHRLTRPLCRGRGRYRPRRAGCLR